MRLVAGLAVAILIAGCTASPPPRQDWPASGGSAAGTHAISGWSHCPWQFREGREDFWALQPASDGHDVFAISYPGGLWSIDASSGEPRWRAQALPDHRFFNLQSPVVGNGTVFAVQQPDDIFETGWAVSAHQAATGRMVWNFTFAPRVFVFPIAVDQDVLVVPTTAGVMGLHAASGLAAWETDWVASGPTTLANGLAHIPIDGGLVAVDPTDGTSPWVDVVQGGDRVAIPTFHGGTRFDVHGGPFPGISARQGPNLVWSLDLARTPGRAAAEGDLVFVLERNALLYALDISTGRVAWTFDTGQQAYYQGLGRGASHEDPTSLAVRGGRVVAHAHGHLFVLDAQGGALRAHLNLTSYGSTERNVHAFQSTPILVGDCIIVGTPTAILAIDANDPRLP